MENKERSSRKIKEGVVVSNKMQKTVSVRVERTLRHPHFDKVIRSAKNIMHTSKISIFKWDKKCASWKQDLCLN
jgi:ribosomal protein S17